MQNAIFLGATASILSAVFSSLSYPVNEIAVRNLDLVPVIFTRNAVSALVYLIAIRGRISRVALFEIRRQWKEFALVVAIRGIITEVLFYFILRMSSSIEVMFLTKLEPYVVLLFGWMLGKEGINRKEFLYLLVHVLGAVLLATGGIFSIKGDLLGDALLLLALLLLAFAYHPAASLAIAGGSYHVNGLKTLAVTALTAPFVFTTTPAQWDFSNPGWPPLFVSIVLWDVIGMPLYYEGVRLIPGWLASALRAAGPIAAAPVTVIFFGQSLSPMQLIGAVLIVATSAALSLSAGTQRKAQTQSE